MKIMITGGCGHIGSHLIRELSDEYDVVVVDNMISKRFCSLFNLKDNIKFYEMDFKDLRESHLEDIDCVIHLAACTDATGSFDNIEEVKRVNIEYTRFFLRACDNVCIPKIIFPSSTSIYGVATDEVYEDDTRFVNPQSPYAESKVVIEDYIQEYINQSDWVILRFGTVFGTSPGMRFHTAINKMCYEASLGRPIVVWKQNVDKTRPYLGLNDLTKAVRIAIEHEEAHHEVFNVVTQNIPFSGIMETLKYFKPNVEFNYVDTPLLNQYSYTVNCDKIKNLGYWPSDDVKQGIDKTLQLLGKLNAKF